MPRIPWKRVRRVLVVKLRSIGDTVLATPSLTALRRFLPAAEIDILLEDWVAPVLDGFESVNIITVGSSFADRLRTAFELRRQHYDVAFNLHGGTTATFFTRASCAGHLVGLANYQYSFLYDHLLASPLDFWNAETVHSAEQQLALLGSVGVPVDDRPRTRLVVTEKAKRSVEERLESSIFDPSNLALLHPAAAFATKQWASENFAAVAEFFESKGFQVVAIAAKQESQVLDDLRAKSRVPVTTFTDLSLPEITALAAKSKLFVGNDSGIAHIAAAVNTPSVIVFGSSNRNHWHPWTNAPYELVYSEFHCQPCAGYECKEFGEPKCILSVKPESVFAAIDRILRKMHS